MGFAIIPALVSAFSAAGGAAAASTAASTIGLGAILGDAAAIAGLASAGIGYKTSQDAMHSGYQFGRS